MKAREHTEQREARERAIMLGLWTAVYIARKVGWRFEMFSHAVLLAWNYKPEQETRPAA